MSSIICGRCAATASSFALRRRARLPAENTPWFTYVNSKSIRKPNIQDYPSFIHTPRHAASSTSSKSQQSQSRMHTVNPPLSTLPAKLDMPPSPSSTTTVALPKRLSLLMAYGKAYLTFYKTGLKNVYHNYKDSLPIRRALGLPSYLPISPSLSAKRGSGEANSFQKALNSLQLTRADFQLVRRAAHDVRRMIPFTILLIICGEFTPFIVAAVGDAVTPFTCRIPRQVERTRKKRIERKQSALKAVQGGLGSVTPIPLGSAEEMEWLSTQFASRKFASTASAEQILRACAAFGMAKTHDRPSFLVPLIYRPRLLRWVDYLNLDDKLIVSGGGVRALSDEEVRIAVDERGGAGIASGSGSREIEEERRWLKRWLSGRKEF